MVPLFLVEASHQFDPLAKRFGLTRVNANDWNLRYESTRVFLSVNFDNGRSYELGVEIGRKDMPHPEPPFSLPEILRLQGVQSAAEISGMMISDPTKLPNALSVLAKLTVDYASDFLKGKGFAFAQVEKMRSREGAEFELESRLRHARSVVAAAWLAKDYETVVRVLEPLESCLLEGEKKKLAYSQKKLPEK